MLFAYFSSRDRFVLIPKEWLIVKMVKVYLVALIRIKMSSKSVDLGQLTPLV